MPAQTKFLYFVSIPLNFLFLFSDSLTEKPNFYILFSIGFLKDAGMYSATPEEGFQKTPGRLIRAVTHICQLCL